MNSSRPDLVHPGDALHVVRWGTTPVVGFCPVKSNVAIFVLKYQYENTPNFMLVFQYETHTSLLVKTITRMKSSLAKLYESKLSKPHKQGPAMELRDNSIRIENCQTITECDIAELNLITPGKISLYWDRPLGDHSVESGEPIETHHLLDIHYCRFSKKLEQISSVSPLSLFTEGPYADLEGFIGFMHVVKGLDTFLDLLHEVTVLITHIDVKAFGQWEKSQDEWEAIYSAFYKCLLLLDREEIYMMEDSQINWRLLGGQLHGSTRDYRKDLDNLGVIKWVSDNDVHHRFKPKNYLSSHRALSAYDSLMD